MLKFRHGTDERIIEKNHWPANHDVGTRKIAVDWRLIRFPSDGKMDHVMVDLTSNQLRVSPVFKAGEPVAEKPAKVDDCRTHLTASIDDNIHDPSVYGPGAGDYTCAWTMPERPKALHFASESPEIRFTMTMAINPPTAALLLSEYVDLKPGEWVVQNAANSGVGRWVIAFAKTRGLKTVNIVRRPELVAVGREVGANPTNSMANAIEIGFNAPTRRNPKPAVITKPTVKVMATARTSRHERKASQRMASTVSPVTVLLKAKPFLTLANSSSDIGTGPVRRTFA
ncbi:MAG: hypothetical protein USCAAHI_00173 [Beijerinckiaceae bacterium]|nr:MAG: hypothetical protein USCAAHI_00173 [Beijerinckiaceae bacterium]